MSTMTHHETVYPKRPWKATKADLIPVFALLVLAAVVDYAVVALTPMKGKLAYAFLFFVFFSVMAIALHIVIVILLLYLRRWVY